MTLTKQKGNMYDFVTHTWNPIKGHCEHDCLYCYVKRWGKVDPLRFDEKELKTNLGSGNFIFVGSGCDMFHEGIPIKWVMKTLIHCEKFDNEYLFQTKNPKGFNTYAVPLAAIEKVNLCITLETNRFYKQMGTAPHPMERATDFSRIPLSTKQVTIEPIMDFDSLTFLELILTTSPTQVNIGADSGGNRLPEPDKEKLVMLIKMLEKYTTVHLKKNINRLLK